MIISQSAKKSGNAGGAKVQVLRAELLMIFGAGGTRLRGTHGNFFAKVRVYQSTAVRAKGARGTGEGEGGDGGDCEGGSRSRRVTNQWRMVG